MYKNYYFVWTDYETQDEDYDITGEDYSDFLDTCFNYSRFFMFHYNPHDVQIPNWLNEFAVPIYNITGFSEYQYSFELDAKCVRITPETERWIRSASDSLMSWRCNRSYKNPEDPVFLREDYSIFFRSITHEFDCRFCIKENENIDKILSSGLWVDDINKLPWGKVF